MGIDLALLPVEHDSRDYDEPLRQTDGKSWGFSHSMLRVDAGRLWYEALKDAPTVSLPKDFATFRARGTDGEARYGETKDTPYGEPLTAVTVATILKVLTINDRMSARDRGVLAYLHELDPKMHIALFWH